MGAVSPHIEKTLMTKLEQFFYDNAGYSYDPKTETKEQGKVRCAVDLARAAHYAIDQPDWHFEWGQDDQPCECGEPNCDHLVEYCQLCDGDNLLESLSGISGATDEYRRVVEAELALEAMNKA